jgi:hypothetical protein
MVATRVLVFSVLGLVACKGDDDAGKQIKVRPAAVAPSLNPQTTTTTTAKTPAKVEDKKKGDKSDDEWVPAEFKTGAARWKDTGVYLDGKPIGFLTWGELPIGLQPTWLKDRISAPKRPGTKDLGWRWGQQRFYRFTDYLKAMNVDIAKIRALHVYGPRFSESVVATAKDLQTPLAKDFMFRFGANVAGKAIPKVPEGFAAGRAPDKISAVMIYIEKEPPQLTQDGFVLEGNLQVGVPYFGEPLRGGIRVYLDNRYAAIIKRQELDPKKATPGANGAPTWKLAELLAAQGVDTSNVAEVWVIRDERRQEKFAGAELATMTFQAAQQAKGGVLLTDQLIRTNAIALHTKPVEPTQLPFITTDDD